jgi:sulfite reductase beta subunit-like hemoprotein
MLDSRQLLALAAAARLGSDIVELTSRGAVQIRGLTSRGAVQIRGMPDGSASEAELDLELERILRAGGLIPSVTHDRVRNILASPLGGRHPDALAETDAVVVALDRSVCDDPRLAGLPGRFLFEVDDSSGVGRTIRPGGRAPDVTLRALALQSTGQPRFRLVLGGLATDLVRPAASASGLASAAAAAFLGLRSELAADAWHLADLPDGPARVAARLGGRTRPAAPQADRQPSAPGLTEQSDGRHAVCGLARLGRIDADQLAGLAELASLAECPGPAALPEPARLAGPAELAGLASLAEPAGIRVSPWKTITVVDVAPTDSPVVAARLADLGLDVSATSPWAGLTACAGRGACASARLDVRALAARRAAGGRPAGEAEHWSGCERRCGEPGGARITVAPSGGRIAVRIGPTEQVLDTPAEVLEELGR